VQKDQATTSRFATQEDLKNLPLRDVTAAVALVPGVVSQDDRGTKKLYIRGGRADEVGYFVEGASVRNVVDGQQFTTVIPEALQEFQVQSGGYTAEFGGANAGIVRQTLRSGTSKLAGSLQMETDNFTDQNNEAIGTYSYGYSNYVGTLSGPLFSDNVKFFLAGENKFQRDTRTQFWDGFKVNNIVDDGSQGGNAGDTFNISMKPGNIPGTFENRYTSNGTITYDAYPLTVRVGGTFSWQRNRNNTNPIQNLFNTGRLEYEDQSTVLGTIKLSHFLDKNTFYEVNLNYFDYRRKRYDPIFGDDFLKYSDSLENARVGITNYQSYSIGAPYFSAYGFTFDYPGRVNARYLKSKQNYLGGSIDFTKQIGTEHEIKFGGTFQRYAVRSFSSISSSGMLNFLLTQPDLARTPSAQRDYQFRRQGGNINAYGYDVYGNEIDDGVDGPKHPIFAGIYLLDKIEFSDVIINAGARVDVIDMDDRKLKDPTNPDIDPTSLKLNQAGLQDVPTFVQVSPRLGFAFPVSDRTVFHLQYGKFVQAPQLNVIYAGSGRSALIFGGGNFVADPVGYGLEPERTTQYEIGFTQQISDFAKFDVTGFYKDIKGQIQVDKVTTVSGAVAASYNVYKNGDFATTKGMEFNVTLQRSHRMQASVNYTLSDAQGTGSVGNSAISSVESGNVRPTVISPLVFNQSHRGTVNIDYRYGKNDGGSILEQLGANLLFTFNSGHPYTLSTGSVGQRGPELGAILADDDPRQRTPLEAVGNSTTPWNFNFDLRIDKTVEISGLSFTFYTYIQNLLDTKNIVNVYARTGNAEDDGFLTNPELSGVIVQQLGTKYVEMYRALNLGHRLHYETTQNGDLFGTPRQIRFGVKMEL